MNLFRFTFITALLLGLAFVFLVPPFQKPDENRHYLQTVAISHGSLTCRIDSVGQVYLPVPSSALALPNRLRYRDIAQTYPVKFFLSDFNQSFRLEKGPMVQESQWCSWSAVGYLPSVVGYLLGSISGNELVAFYFARLFSLILFLLVLYYIYPLAPPPLKLWLAIYFILPMTLHQITAIGYDALILILAPIIFVLLGKGLLRLKLTNLQLILLQGSILLTVLAKPAYLPLLLLPLIIIPSQVGMSSKRYWAHQASFFLVSLFLLVFALRTPLYSETIGSVNSALQTKIVFSHPFYFLQVFSHTLVVRGAPIFSEIIGRLGWLDYQLGANWYLIFYLILGGAISYAVVQLRRVRPPFVPTLILGISLVLAIFCVYGSMYLLWSPVGSDIITGVQGRYLLPLFLLFGLFLALAGRLLLQHQFALKMIATIVLLAFSTHVIYQIYLRYWDYTQSGYNDILPFLPGPAHPLDSTSTYTLALPANQGKVVGFSYVASASAELTLPYRYELRSRDCSHLYRAGYLQLQQSALAPTLNTEKVKPFWALDHSLCLRLSSLALPGGTPLQLLPFSTNIYFDPLYIVSSLRN